MESADTSQLSAGLAKDWIFPQIPRCQVRDSNKDETLQFSMKVAGSTDVTVLVAWGCEWDQVYRDRQYFLWD